MRDSSQWHSKEQRHYTKKTKQKVVTAVDRFCNSLSDIGLPPYWSATILQNYFHVLKSNTLDGFSHVWRTRVHVVKMKFVKLSIQFHEVMFRSKTHFILHIKKDPMHVIYSILEDNEKKTRLHTMTWCSNYMSPPIVWPKFINTVTLSRNTSFY
jgi:hypothetical protein